MSYAEFQQRYEEEGGKERARYDALPVASLLADIRAHRFGGQHQIWYSLGARATVAEAAEDLLRILEALDLEYLHRYHCAAALVQIARLDRHVWTSASLASGGQHNIRENLRKLRQALGLPPGENGAAPSPAAAVPAPAVQAAPPPVPRPSSPRSPLLTALAWGIIILSALVSVISFFSLIMFLVGSYGTANADPLEALLMIGGPPAMLVAGIGLLCRQSWARFIVLAAVVACLAHNIHGIIKGPSPEKKFVSPSGVPTTTLASPAQYSVPVMAVCAGVFLFLLLPGIRSEFVPLRRR